MEKSIINYHPDQTMWTTETHWNPVFGPPVIASHEIIRKFSFPKTKNPKQISLVQKNENYYDFQMVFSDVSLIAHFYNVNIKNGNRGGLYLTLMYSKFDGAGEIVGLGDDEYILTNIVYLIRGSKGFSRAGSVFDHQEMSLVTRLDHENGNHEVKNGEFCRLNWMSAYFGGTDQVEGTVEHFLNVRNSQFPFCCSNDVISWRGTNNSVDEG